MDKKPRQESPRTRRQVLKKAGIASAFVIPTITTFSIADLAQASSPPADVPPPPP